MNVKRYFAKTAREALRMLKDELGPDAVVLSNRLPTAVSRSRLAGWRCGQPAARPQPGPGSSPGATGGGGRRLPRCRLPPRARLRCRFR